MITLSIGHNVHGTPTHTHNDVLRVFACYMAAHGIQGYTAYETSGCYLGEVETSSKIELFDEVEDLPGLLVELCDTLDQDAIYANEYTAAAFYEGRRTA